MNDSSTPVSLDEIYAQLEQQDIEQFYAGYRRWNTQQRIAALRTEIASLQRQIVENEERLQEIHPSAIALATLARLQAHGVSDIDLLDQMLERGESWLDQTMQRLDYCEQLADFITNDYTQWCRHALDGAYDWIDSIQDAGTSSSPLEPLEEEPVGATEEQLLQRLSSEEEEEISMLATTLKRPAITSSSSEALAEEDVATSDGEQTAVQEYIALEEPLAVEDQLSAHAEQPMIQEYAILDAVEDRAASEDSELVIQEYASYEEPPDTALSDAELSAIQEHVLLDPVEDLPASESISIEDLSADDMEQPIQEYASSDSGEEIPALQGEGALQELIVPEEPHAVESSAIPQIEQPAIQEAVEISPASDETLSTLPEPPEQEEEPAPAEASIPATENDQENVQVDVPASPEQQSHNRMTKKRPNFLVRWLQKIWGR